MAGTPKPAPNSSETSAGNVTAWSDGKHTYSDAVPNARPRWAFQVHTRSPMRLSSMPSPTLSISPAPSLCGMMSG